MSVPSPRGRKSTNPTRGSLRAPFFAPRLAATIDKDFAMRYLTALLCLLALPAFADPVTVSWQMPTSNCDGSQVLPGDLTNLEIYVSTSTIPAVGTSYGTERDTPPPGGTATVVEPDVAVTQIDIDLAPGATYFIRMRVRNAQGEWSNFSNEVSRFVAFPRPDVPTITIINLG